MHWMGNLCSIKWQKTITTAIENGEDGWIQQGEGKKEIDK